MGADARRSGGSLAASRNTAGGHRRLVCLHLHLCCYLFFLAVALLFGKALHVFACVRVCVSAPWRNLRSVAEVRAGRSRRVGIGRTNDNSSEIKIKITSLKQFSDVSNGTKMNGIFSYQLAS